MSRKPKEITEENALTVDVATIARDTRFSDLKFENAKNKLPKIQKWLLEIWELGGQDLLIQNDQRVVADLTRQLIEHLNRLLTFDIRTTSDNALQEHSNIEGRIDTFYNNIYQQLPMRILPFLREERRREKPEEKMTDEEIRKMTQIRKELEGELKKVQEETKKVRVASKEVGAAKGERASVRLATHFASEAENYQNVAKLWLIATVAGYTILLVVLTIFGIKTVQYFSDILSGGNEKFDRGIIFSIGIAKLVFVAALWYGLSFMVKNYRVNSHLAVVNRHRTAVASTLEDFIAIEKQQTNPRLSEMLQNATKAMFKHSPVGFITKSEKESENPLLEIINKIANPKSD